MESDGCGFQLPSYHRRLTGGILTAGIRRVLATELWNAGDTRDILLVPCEIPAILVFFLSM
jgi:hypothetical protein